jgi:hypothetical protein
LIARDHRLLLTTYALVAAGCSAHSAAADRVPQGRARLESALQQATPPPIDTVPKVDASIDSSLGPASIAENLSDVAPSPPPPVDPARWLADRGVREGAVSRVANAFGCREVSVGRPLEAGIECTEAGEARRGDGIDAVYRVLVRRTIRVVRSRRPVVALDILEAVTPLDKEEATQPDLVNLEVLVAPDGLSLVVRDRSSDFELGRGDRQPSVSCDEALAKRSSSPTVDAAGARWDRFDRELVLRACSQRGRWVWAAGRFSRASRNP